MLPVWQGKTVVAVTSGANMNFDRLRLVADLAAVGARQEAIFVTTIPEKIGSFQHFLDVALADTDIQITEFKYRCSTVCCPPLSSGLAISRSATTTHELAEMQGIWDCWLQRLCRCLVKNARGSKPEVAGACMNTWSTGFS